MHYALGILITVAGVAWSAISVMATGMSDIYETEYHMVGWGVAVAALGLAIIFLPW